MGVNNCDGSEVKVVILQPEENALIDKPSLQGGPSKAYEIGAFFGVLLLVFDFCSDFIVGIFTIVTGRFVQGFFTLLIITFPMFFHCVSRVYKEQLGLIKMDEVYAEEDRDLRCKICLSGRIFDSIIWAYNHYRQTVQYRQDSENEKKRQKFYLSKQMAQISLKNEARLEAYYQVVLTFFGLIYYFDEYTVSSKILVIASISFSSISIARAACTDLKKTQCRFWKEPYPNQTCLWKICRLISVIGATFARMISHGVFVLYCVQLFSEGFQENMSGLTDFLLAIIAYIIFHLFCEPLILWIYFSDWEFLQNEIKQYKIGIPIPKSTHTIVMYLMLYSPFLFFYRAPALKIYAFSVTPFILLGVVNLVSVNVTFLPILWLTGLSSPVFIVLTSSFAISILLCIIFMCVTRKLTNLP